MVNCDRLRQALQKGELTRYSMAAPRSNHVLVLLTPSQKGAQTDIDWLERMRLGVPILLCYGGDNSWLVTYLHLSVFLVHLGGL